MIGDLDLGNQQQQWHAVPARPDMHGSSRSHATARTAPHHPDAPHLQLPNPATPSQVTLKLAPLYATASRRIFPGERMPLMSIDAVSMAACASASFGVGRILEGINLESRCHAADGRAW